MDDKSHKFAGELLEWIKSILRDLGIETGRVDEMEGIIYSSDSTVCLGCSLDIAVCPPLRFSENIREK